MSPRACGQHPWQKLVLVPLSSLVQTSNDVTKECDLDKGELSFAYEGEPRTES